MQGLRRIDLHTHSDASDGTTSPGDLVRAAAQSGLDVVAITDHDTAAGWDEAVGAAREVGIELVRGMEISTKHSTAGQHGEGVHLLAYLPDPSHRGLTAVLDQILRGRDDRLPRMLARLRERDIEVSEDDVRAANPGTDVIGRPHVADALVARGVVPDRRSAFEQYLKQGRPAYVDRYAAPLTEAIDLVTAAGGVTVLAHPWGRGRGRSLPPEEIGRLAEAGLTGLEVDHQDHPPEARAALRGIARDTGLVATGSSDHHGLGKTDHELGCNTTEPDEYERLLDAAASASGASGRATPTVVRP